MVWRVFSLDADVEFVVAFGTGVGGPRRRARNDPNILQAASLQCCSRCQKPGHPAADTSTRLTDHLAHPSRDLGRYESVHGGSTNPIFTIGKVPEIKGTVEVSPG